MNLFVRRVRAVVALGLVGGAAAIDDVYLDPMELS